MKKFSNKQARGGTQTRTAGQVSKQGLRQWPFEQPGIEVKETSCTNHCVTKVLLSFITAHPQETELMVVLDGKTVVSLLSFSLSCYVFLSSPLLY